jgi:hypothetical protein
MKLKKGDLVRVTALCHSRHREFLNCIGVVEGLVNYGVYEGEVILGPEIDVRWRPSNLRYAYKANELVKLSDDEVATLEVVEC